MLLRYVHDRKHRICLFLTRFWEENKAARGRESADTRWQITQYAIGHVFGKVARHAANVHELDPGETAASNSLPRPTDPGDALMAEALLPSLPKGWKRAIVEIAKRTHALFIRHPWALSAMLSAPPGLNAMRHMEQCLEALAETSMTGGEKLTLLAMVDDFVFGHALREAADHSTVDAEFAKAQLRSGAFPRLVEVFGDGRLCGQGDRFEYGLRKLLSWKPDPNR